MAIHITETEMTSSVTRHFASPFLSSWKVSWLNRVLTRDEAVTAMNLAELAEQVTSVEPGWRTLSMFARELQLDPNEAAAMCLRREL